MSSSSEGRIPYVPAELQSALRWVGTSNPFYVISAGLFLIGLWLSFGDPQQAEDTWALMAGLAAYTLVLAATGYLLIRFAGVWDDARSVLLLVVLMFLATSVTFDRVIVFDVVEKRWPIRGFACVLLGLSLAVAVSEAVLRGVRLALPACYRVPYYLLLALFFLYPLGLTPFLEDRKGAPMMWGLFGFATAAGLIFLTLLPAVRRGSEAVARNGNPWPWPLYPWSLFGLFALVVPARAILLCYSMHLIDVLDLYDMTFGPYFLVPFALCLAVLLLEAGIVTKRVGVLWTALAAPIGLIALAWIGQRGEPIYEEFLTMFISQLGGDPVYWTMILCAGFYAYAALRRIPWTIEALTASVLVLTVVDPKVMTTGVIVAPQPIPLIAASTLLLGLGLWRRGSWRCLFGALGLIAGMTMMIAGDPQLAPFRWLLAYHLALIALLLIGATFDDNLGRALRNIAPVLAVIVGLVVLLVPIQPPENLPIWVLSLYPLALAIGLAAYGFWHWQTLTMGLAAALFVIWSAATGWQVYRHLRQLVAGLDYLALSLCIFPAAIVISLAKAGILLRWWKAWRQDQMEEFD
jgi:hypothetical protein